MIVCPVVRVCLDSSKTKKPTGYFRKTRKKSSVNNRSIGKTCWVVGVDVKRSWLTAVVADLVVRGKRDRQPLSKRAAIVKRNKKTSKRVVEFLEVLYGQMTTIGLHIAANERKTGLFLFFFFLYRHRDGCLLKERIDVDYIEHVVLVCFLSTHRRTMLCAKSSKIDPSFFSDSRFFFVNQLFLFIHFFAFVP